MTYDLMICTVLLYNEEVIEIHILPPCSPVVLVLLKFAHHRFHRSYNIPYTILYTIYRY